MIRFFNHLPKVGGSPPVKTDRCDMTEKLLKVALNPNQANKQKSLLVSTILICYKELSMEYKTLFEFSR